MADYTLVVVDLKRSGLYLNPILRLAHRYNFGVVVYLNSYLRYKKTQWSPLRDFCTGEVILGPSMLEA